MLLQDRGAERHRGEARPGAQRVVAEPEHGVREAPRRTRSYGVGYIDVQCSNPNGTPASRRMRTAGSMERRSFIPVLRITGRPKEAMWRMSG